MATLRPLTSADAMLLKQLRLTALQDTPAAFGSTFAREASFTDAQWQEKAAAWSNGTTGICHLALEADGTPCGIAAGYVPADQPDNVFLVSMWVAQSARRQGIGRRLVDLVEAWGRQIGAAILSLHVTEGNTAAEALYRRMGFTPTGERGPHQAHPQEIVYVMAKSLTSVLSSAQ